MIQRLRSPLSRAWMALAVLALLFPGVSHAAPKFVPGELIVRFKPNVHASARAQLRAAMHADLKHDFRGFLDLEHVKLKDLSVEQAIAKFGRHKDVLYVEPNYVITADVIPNDTRFNELYAMRNTGQTGGTAGADIKAYLAWDQYTGDPNLKIGIIDTGIDYTHPDLAANVWTNPGEIPGNGVDDDGNGFVDDVHGYDFANSDGDPFDDNGHGSHCAGTIAGVGNNNVGVTGVNWNARIVAIKFLNASGSGSTDGAIRGIQYAITVGARLTSNSWGGGSFSQSLLDAINAAGAAGQLFVAAAGNSGSDNDTSPHYPSSYDSPYVLAVAATDHNDALASFSCYGATSVDIAAPGVDILSCQPGGGYQLLSGTSMATPHVSGVVALAMGRFPAMSNLQVKQLVMNAADHKASLTGKCVTGGRLNAFMTIAEPDETPPGQITDLATAGPSSNALGLAWTATGDDGSIGRATSYEIRYSTAPIDATSWSSATLVAGPDPLVAGSPQAFEVPGLAFNTTYWFGIKALDEFGNAGPLSNVPSGTTLGIPDIEAAPSSFSASLLSGAGETQTLTLTNLGAGTLDFQVPTPELIFAQQALHPFVDVPKGADGPAGEPVADNQGGPDGFGYRWTDSNESGGPSFDWVDITGVGTPVSLTGDDATSAAIPLGMDFPFYGNSFNSVRICTNGWLSFTDAASSYSNQALPNSGAPANLLAPLWDDLDFGTVQRAYTYFDGVRFIASFVAVPHYSTGGPYTFQVILYPTGEIRYQYLSVADPTNSLTVGMQNATKDVGLTVAYNTTYLTDHLAIRIFPLTQWLTVSPASGRIAAGTSQDLQVRFDALGLMGGTYDGSIRVLSNDPDGSPLALPAALHVTGAPDIAVTPAALDFGTPFAGATLTGSLVVSNPGTDDLVISGVTSTDPTLTVPGGGFTLHPRAAQSLAVTWHPTTPMSLNALVRIASNDPDAPVKEVPVTGEAVPAPSFAVTPESFDVALLTNTATTRSLRITNSGGSNYVFTAEAMVPTTASAPSVSVEQHDDDAQLIKGARDDRFGPAPERTGGPDVFGYSYADSDEPTGPAFGWVDVRAAGTQVNISSDDQNSGALPIGFAFPFYGKTFTNFRVCTNGWVSFTSALTAYSNTALPNTGSSVPENLLAVFWDDLNFYSVKRAYYYNDGSRLVIQYQDVSRYGDSSHPNSFEIILYPNGTIVYQYLNITATTLNSLTIGVQNEAKNDGLQVVYNAAYVKSNLAIRFKPPARFLTVTPTAGTVPPGGYVDLTVGFNASGLFGGVYDGIVRVQGNDPVLPQKDVPARVTVTGVPDVAVAPATLAFGDVFLGYPHIQQVSVTNSGTDVLHVTGITTSDAAYGVNMASVDVPALGTAVLDVSFNPGSVGAYPATLSLASNDPDTPVKTVELSGAGIVAPDVDVTPTSIATTLPIPGTDTRTLTLRNTGGSDLHVSVGTVITATSVPIYPAEPELGKDEKDSRPGVLGSGGPDVFGYTWRDSDDPDGPAFDWVDITGIGAPITLTSGDDANVQGIPIGFDFPYYGNTFNTVNVCTNGWLSFTSTVTALSNYALPNSSAPENLLAPFWDDLNPGTTDTRLYRYSDGTRFILSYIAVPRYSSGGPYTFQVILYPSGRIVYQYLDMQGTRLNEATVGIQNAAKDDGLTAVFNDAYVHDGLAVEFATVPDYMTVTPSTGTVPAGGSMDVAVSFNTAGMFGGVYHGSLRVASNDPDEAVVVVPTELTAVGMPDLAAAPASLDFGWQYVGLSRDLTLEVRNAGSDVLTVTGATLDNPAYALVGATFPITLGNHARTLLTVRFAPTAACAPCAGVLTLASNDSDLPETTVPLTGMALVPPEIGVAPASLRAALATTLCPTAISATKMLVIENTGGSDLTWTAEALSALPMSAQAEMTETGKDQAGTAGQPTLEANGGPDAFGYRWADSNDPLGAPFAWVDIAAVGTAIPFDGDDQFRGPFPLPFPFTYYGSTYTEFYAATNGWITFSNYGSAPYTNYALPSTSAPPNLVAPFWDDLTFSTSGDAYYHDDGTKFIISYVGVPRLGSGGPYTFQILLYPSGTIDFQYLDMQGTRLNEATVGIQNATQDVGLQVAYNAAYVENELRVRFSSQPGWLTAAPLSGTTPAGERDTVLVHFDATGLADGDYEGALRIASNDLDEPLTLVPCYLHVGVAPAVFDLDPNSLNRSSNGNWVQGIVTPPEGLVPQDIRTASVLLQCTLPVATGAPLSYEDGAAYYKFSRSGLQAILPVGNAVPVQVVGEVTDVTWFAAWDTIRVLRPKMTSAEAPAAADQQLASPEEFGGGTPIRLAWEDPEGYAPTSYELWYSEDAGQSWSSIVTGLTAHEYHWIVPPTTTEGGVLELVALDELGVMGSWLSSVFHVMEGSAAGVGDDVPDHFGLRFLGANPAAHTRLELALPLPSDVTVSVHDIRGALVRTLASGSLEAGRHPLRWDGVNATGRPVGPGIYFVRAKAGGQSQTLRVVHVK
jgi:subtilisin family serine protease